MSQNAALVYRAFDAFNPRDLDAFLELITQDVEVRSRLVAVEGGYHGHGGVRRSWSNLLEAIPDINESRFMLVRWRDRKCVRWTVFSDETEALEAAGLAE